MAIGSNRVLRSFPRRRKIELLRAPGNQLLQREWHEEWNKTYGYRQ